MEDPPTIRNSITRLGSVQAAFTFLLSIFGTSLVATPHGFSLATPQYGLVLLILALIFSWVGAECLMKAAITANAISFFDLGSKAFRDMKLKKVYILVLIVLPFCGTMLGGLASYIIIVSDIIVKYYPSQSVVLLRIIIAAVMFSLGLIRSFYRMKYISYVCLAATLGVGISILIASFQIAPSIIRTEQHVDFKKLLSAVPILVFGLTGHPGLPGMASEMDPRHHPFISHISFTGPFIACVLLVFIGYTPAVILGSNVEDDIVRQLYETTSRLFGSISVPVTMAQALLGLVVIIKSPIMTLPLKEILLNDGKHHVEERSWVANTIATFGIIALAASLAIFLESLSSVISTVGGISAIVTTGISSGILSLLVEHGKVARTRAVCVLSIGTMLLGIDIAGIIGVL